MDMLELKERMISKLKKKAEKNGVSTERLEELLEIFFEVIFFESPNNDVNDKSTILLCLEKRYLLSSFDELATCITSITIKMEAFIKKIFEYVSIPNNGELASLLKEMFRNKNILNRTDINKFFEKDANKNPTTPASYFENKFIFAVELKETYDVRNVSGHKNVQWEDEVAIHNIDSAVLAYLAIVNQYYSDLLGLRQNGVVDNDSEIKWNDAYEKCKYFDKNNSYFLIADKMKISKEGMSVFANINWDIILDFDISSDIDGLYASNIVEYSSNKAVLKLVNSGSERNITSVNSTYWSFVLGNKGIQESLVTEESFVKWQKKYYDYINDIFKQYNNISKCNSIIVLVICQRSKYVEHIIERMYNVFNNRVEFVFLNEKNEMYKDIMDDPGMRTSSCDIPIEVLANGLNTLENKFWKSDTSGIYVPDNSDIGKKKIEALEVQLIRRFFEIIHLNIAWDSRVNETKNKSFYQGREITWREIHEGNVAANRLLFKTISNDIDGFLSNRSLGGRVYLYHAPGAGGTTLGKMVAYSFSKEYPTIELVTYDKRETVDEVHRIFSMTNKPVLIYIDNDSITEMEIAELSKACENKFVKSVIFAIRKSFSDISDKKNHKYYLKSKIERNEEESFKKLFIGVAGNHSEVVEKIFSNQNSREMTPFYIGLCAYEREYLTISEYVKCRLDENGTTGKQKKILLYLAFFTYYGKYGENALPSYVFKKYLNEINTYVLLEDYLNLKAQQDLIIACENLSWKIVHPILAEEILLQELGKTENSKIDPSELKNLCVDFIDLFAKEFESPSKEVLDILRGIFIVRDYNNDEVIDAQASQNASREKLARVITDLRFSDYQIEVMDHLTKCYPTQEPHFWAHLARLYSISEYIPESIAAVGKGIELLDENNRRDYFVLYHVRGMCYRTQAYVIKDNNYGIVDCSIEKIDKFKYYFEMASKEFKETRKVAPKREHGYVSYVQMVIQAIHFGYSLKKAQYDSVTKFLGSIDGKWYNSILADAAHVVDDYLKKVKEEQKNNMLVQKAELAKYYEDGNLISSWYNLLNKSDTNDKNYIRRNVVYGYLARVQFDWKKLQQKDLQNIEKYLRENLLNYPEQRDVNNWVTAARLLNISIRSIVRTLEKSLVYNETIETYFYLSCFYLVDYLNGVEISKPEFIKYKELLEKCKKKSHYIYCPEWISKEDGKYKLIMAEDVGIWDRENSFFKNNEPTKLNRLNGMTKEIHSKGQGFIELSGLGINVFYVPGADQHYKININQRVNFYLGVNYDGLRAFKVKDGEIE